MPIHDWSEVDANLFHHFHQFWTTEICRALNDGLLPPGFSALVEQHAGGLVPDVLALQRRGKNRPDPSGGTLLAEPPTTAFVYERKEDALASRANRVAIHHRLGEVVCIIEIVSPGNKSSKAALHAFVEKTVEFVNNGIHILVVDLFPPSKRDPNGIHDAIWQELGGADFEISLDKPLTLAAYVAGDGIYSPKAYVEPVAVGQVLPDMPAFLDRRHHVPIPLEATYQAAWKTCPSDMKILVETGHLPDETPG